MQEKYNIIQFAACKNHLGLYPGSEAVKSFQAGHEVNMDAPERLGKAFKKRGANNMLEKLNRFLNLVIGSVIGVFIGHGIYVYWSHQKHPELYAMQSAPWYVGVLLYGMFTIAVLVVVLILKLIIRILIKRKDRNRETQIK